MRVGRVTLVLGCMFSGKTTEMQQRIRDAVIGLRPTVVLSPSRDTRSTLVSSHDGSLIAAQKLRTLGDASIPQHPQTLIGIDEGQFFDDLYEFCLEETTRGHDIVIAALNADFQQKGWPTVLRVLPIAFDVVWKHATCILCQGRATCSRRISEGGDQVDVGGDDKYVATCPTCFTKPISPDVIARRARAVAQIKQMSN